MTTAQPCSVGIVGAGNMGGSLLQGLLDAVNDFTGETPQADDMTCVVVRAAS